MIRCQLPDHDHPATHSVAWRSPSMSAPAFWYVCEDGLENTAGLPNATKRELQDPEFPLSVDVSDNVKAAASGDTDLAEIVRWSVAGINEWSSDLTGDLVKLLGHVQRVTARLDSTRGTDAP